METVKKTDAETAELLFTKARTHYHWHKREIPDSLLKEIYALAIMGPTSANCCPMRIIFLKSDKAKERLRPALAPGNVEKTLTAPVVAVIGYDLEFYEKLPKLFPHADAKSWFVGKAQYIHDTAFRNGSLQAAYFMLAARSLGLDCGPMSGFSEDVVNKEFFPDGKIKVNMLCNIGYGDHSKLHPRLPRPEFGEVCEVV